MVHSFSNTYIDNFKQTPKDNHTSSACVTKRERAIQELVETERKYNTNLCLIITYYVQPLNDYKLISSEQHNILFSQIRIIKGVSYKFLADLNKRRQNWDPKTSKLSDLFVTFTPCFKMYQDYLNNYGKASGIMQKLENNKKWNTYCQSVKGAFDGHTLDSLLILPTQRLMKYPLLLKEIVKNTPNDHPDFIDLATAFDAFSKTCHEINSKKREFEQRAAVKRIEQMFNGSVDIMKPHRRFIREGKVWEIGQDKDRSYEYFLFNDILICGKFTSLIQSSLNLIQSKSNQKYDVDHKYKINETLSCDLITDGHNYGNEKNGKLFKIMLKGKSVVSYTETIEEATKWTKCIKECITEQSEKTHAGHHRSKTQRGLNLFDLSKEVVRSTSLRSQPPPKSQNEKQKQPISASISAVSSHVNLKNEEAVENHSPTKPKKTTKRKPRMLRKSQRIMPSNRSQRTLHSDNYSSSEDNEDELSDSKARCKAPSPTMPKNEDEIIETPIDYLAISYKDLKNKQFGNVNVDKKRLEDYLSNAEFFEVFQMSRNEFYSKPEWKQKIMKKDKGLF